MTQLKTIYDESAVTLNIVATDIQLNAVFNMATREFFSYVYPIFFIQEEDFERIQNSIEETIKYGYKDTTDALEVGAGDFKVMELVRLDDLIGMRVKPLNYNAFLLEEGYSGAFQFCCEFFLHKIEKENMSMLKSAGIEDNESYDTQDINTLRDYLRKEFGVTTAGLII
ncbi:MAG: hypothetical protein GQ474_05965 [Sulfurimonas sp.]|nr:hypothetical protein [Sulfurimonas sp.]